MAPIRSKLMEISYSDPKFQIRLTGYADTVIIDSGAQQTISAIRFSGYPEVVRALSDAIYGGASVELKQDDTTLCLFTKRMSAAGYQKSLLQKNGKAFSAHRTKRSGSLPSWKAIGNCSARRRTQKKKNGKPPSSLRTMK